MKLKVCMRPECPWTDELRSVLRKYDLAYEEFVSELDWKSPTCPCKLGDVRFPCVSVNGVLLPDVSGTEFESYLLAHGLVKPRNNEPMDIREGERDVTMQVL